MKQLVTVLIFTIVIFTKLFGQIIDMHLHVFDEEGYWKVGKHPMGPESPKTLEEFYHETIQEMDKNNIQYALISGHPEVVRAWKKRDKRFIGGYEYIHRDLVDTVEFKKLIEEGTMQAWAEMGSVYRGETLADPKFEPYIKICERYNIPIGYHTGSTKPGSTYGGPFRISISDPWLIEDVLSKYPKLKIYLMHGGGSFRDHTIELMYLYPHVYVDIAALLWFDYKTMYEVVDFLKKAKEARLLDKVMFGSDQMMWPGGITKSIEFLNALDFLTKEEKHMIFYTNAATFLGIKDK